MEDKYETPRQGNVLTVGKKENETNKSHLNNLLNNKNKNLHACVIRNKARSSSSSCVQCIMSTVNNDCVGGGDSMDSKQNKMLKNSNKKRNSLFGTAGAANILLSALPR